MRQPVLFLDQAAVALQSDNMGLRHAAANCVMRFVSLNSTYLDIVRKALKGLIEL